MPSDALARRFDSLLLDLDGVVYVGKQAVPGAGKALAELRAAGIRVCYVTNNASRTPQQVAEQLTGFGIDLAPEDVLTSAQAGARLVAERVPAGSPVLAVGGPGVAAALREIGLDAVDAVADPTVAGPDDVVAVLQGFGPDVGWRALARASFAAARGVPWVATNTDMTLPLERGLAPGNGTLVAAVAAASGRSPEVAGKPYPPLLLRAAEVSNARRPLVVGDRLDTDIEGAKNAQLPSLLVLTGVTGTLDLWRAPGSRRPDFLARDLTGLLRPPLTVEVTEGVARAGTAIARIDDGLLTVEASEDPLEAIWAAAHLVWQADEEPRETIEVAAQLDNATGLGRSGSRR